MKNKEATLKSKLKEMVEELHHCGFNQSVDCIGYKKEVSEILKLISKEIKKNRPKEKYYKFGVTKGEDLFTMSYNSALSDYDKSVADTLGEGKYGKNS